MVHRWVTTHPMNEMFHLWEWQLAPMFITGTQAKMFLSLAIHREDLVDMVLLAKHWLQNMWNLVIIMILEDHTKFF